MFDLIIQNFHKQHCKKKEKFEEQSNTHTLPRENIVVEIDYDKLAEALMKAESKAQEERQKKEKEEHERLQLEWEKALKCVRYRGNKWWHKIFDFITVPFRVSWGLITFHKKNATEDNATYALFKICNEYMLGVYQFVFGILALASLVCTLGYNQIQVLSISRVWFGIMTFFFFLIERIIRIVKLESANSKNKKAITTIFGSIVSFTAMVCAAITVIITLRIGG
ncbi:MAG: hypothetical protein IJ419_08175 [Agathobacter sp.]|nr:hypothetical protein [Agathobacter sp.]